MSCGDHVIISELARAKINLSLGVRGRRPDGYHELASHVAFASAGDRLVLTPGDETTIAVTGPFAAAIDGPNLIAKVIDAVAKTHPRIRFGRFTLEKNLPVAAGIGGGSADAAAALRAIRHANPELDQAVDWRAIAAGLGADVPVCLGSRAAFMWGIGHDTADIGPLPETHAVLVNPRVTLSTAHVFAALGAEPVPAHQPAVIVPNPFASFEAMIALLHRHPNGLQPTATTLCPTIDDVIAALQATRGCRLARLSGSGATCFGLYSTTSEAGAARAQIAAEQPGWWAVAAALQ